MGKQEGEQTVGKGILDNQQVTLSAAVFDFHFSVVSAEEVGIFILGGKLGVIVNSEVQLFAVGGNVIYRFVF